MLAASRTRRSCQGDFGSHWSGKSSQKTPGGCAGTSVGPGADRGLLEAVVADLLDVLPGHDPAGPGGRAAVEGHEVGPGLLEMEPHARRVDHLDLADFVL